MLYAPADYWKLGTLAPMGYRSAMPSFCDCNLWGLWGLWGKSLSDTLLSAFHMLFSWGSLPPLILPRRRTSFVYPPCKFRSLLLTFNFWLFCGVVSVNSKEEPSPDGPVFQYYVPTLLYLLYLYSLSWWYLLTKPGTTCFRVARQVSHTVNNPCPQQHIWQEDKTSFYCPYYHCGGIIQLNKHHQEHYIILDYCTMNVYYLGHTEGMNNLSYPISALLFVPGTISDRSFVGYFVNKNEIDPPRRI